MSGQLDYREDGQGNLIAAVLLNTVSAWHREGVVMPGNPTLGQALDLGGLNFPVEKVPHHIEVPVGTPGAAHLKTEVSGEYVRRWPWWRRQMFRTRAYMECPDSFTVVRTDSWDVLGTVGKVWEPLQNRDAFAPLQPILNEGMGFIETAGSLRGGADVWMVVQFDYEAILRTVLEKYGADKATMVEDMATEVLPFALFTNDHSGARKARIKMTAIRVESAGTLDFSKGRDEQGMSVEVTHSSNVAQNYKAAADRLMGSVATQFLAVAAARAALKNTRLSVVAFNRLVLDPSIPIWHLEAKIQRGEDSGRTRWAFEQARAKRSRVRALWTGGEGHAGDFTAWEALNGLVQYLDHDGDAFNGGSRVASLMTGTLGQAKRKVTANLVKYAGAREEEQLAMVRTAGPRT